MGGHVKIMRYPSAALRPDLSVPLPPMSGIGAVLRSGVIRLREPRFADAQRATRRGAIVAMVLLISQFVVAAWLRPWIGLVGMILALCLAARAIALALLERRQHRFEREWLAVQSDVLRDTWFEVVRCTLQPRYDPQSDLPESLGYDLTRPDNVRRLLTRQATERASGRSSHATVEFIYSLGGVRNAEIEAVYPDLIDITVVPAADHVRHAGANFPQARYHAQPNMNRGDWRWPSRATFWVLGPLVLSVASPDGISSDARPAEDLSASAANTLIP